MAGYNNGNLSTSQVKEMQGWYGTTADGMWGSSSTAAASGMGANSAYNMYQNNKSQYKSYSAMKAAKNGGTQSSTGTSTGYSGGGYNNSGLTASQIKEMQSWYGTTADGIWGKNSTAAASGMGVNSAYNMYQNNKGQYSSYNAMKAAKNNGSAGYKPGNTSAAGSSAANPNYTGGGSGRPGSSSDSSYGGSYGGADSGSGGAPLPGYDAGSNMDYGSGYDVGYDYSGPMSYSDYLARVGGDDYQAAVQKAIEAQVQAAADQYNSQIESAGRDYEEAARRAYVSKMMSQRNLDQELAANGVYGGMADSQRIATETTYENNLNDLTQQYQSTIADLQQAITSAKLAGDAQAAEAMANYLSQVQAQYASYLQNERGIQAEIDMFNRQLAAQQAQQAAATSYGSSGGGRYSGGGGYNNGGLTTAQIMEMQNALGVTADGKWGSQSMAAANGMSAADAWNAYQQAKQTSGIQLPDLGLIAGRATLSGIQAAAAKRK